MRNYIPMTFSGVQKLQKELNHLKNIIRPRIITAIAKAREHGDLKENSEYHAAREEQSFCEGRIQEIENKLSNVQVIDIKKLPNVGKVVFGVTVTILNICTNQKFKYCIVGDEESDLKKKLISVNSPLARGLIGKKLYEIVLIKTPSGGIKYKILRIEHL